MTTLPTVPSSIYRVSVNRSGMANSVFTSRRDVRNYRRTLRDNGVPASAVTVTRFPVGDGVEMTSL